jgi:hypothetical protein
MFVYPELHKYLKAIISLSTATPETDSKAVIPPSNLFLVIIRHYNQTSWGQPFTVLKSFTRKCWACVESAHLFLSISNVFESKKFEMSDGSCREFQGWRKEKCGVWLAGIEKGREFRVF